MVRERRPHTTNRDHVRIFFDVMRGIHAEVRAGLAMPLRPPNTAYRLASLACMSMSVADALGDQLYRSVDKPSVRMDLAEIVRAVIKQTQHTSESVELYEHTDADIWLLEDCFTRVVNGWEAKASTAWEGSDPGQAVELLEAHVKLARIVLEFVPGFAEIQSSIDAYIARSGWDVETFVQVSETVRLFLQGDTIFAVENGVIWCGTAFDHDVEGPHLIRSAIVYHTSPNRESQLFRCTIPILASRSPLGPNADVFTLRAVVWPSATGQCAVRQACLRFVRAPILKLALP